MLKLLFGGSFGYVQAALVGIAGLALVWLWQDYKGAKKDVERLTGDVERLEGVVVSKDSVIASMGRSGARRDAQSQDAKDLGNDILQANDGKACANSDAIRVALDGLRNSLEARTANATDKAIPVLAGAYPATTE